MSKGENKIIFLLNKAHIQYYREKTFEDLHKGLYRFDFYLPNVDGARVIIEFDGEQHFHQVKKYQKTRAEFLHTQENDRRKNSYCLAHDIQLYRIPYWELDNLNSISDLFQEKFLVKSKWHNDQFKI